MKSVLLLEQSKRIFEDKCKKKVYWLKPCKPIDQPAMLINQPVHCFSQSALLMSILEAIQMSIYIAEKWKTYKVNNATSHILLYSRRQECKIHVALMPPSLT